MNHRRVIGSILALAMLAGTNLVPLARAACAVPKPKVAACPSCNGSPSSQAASISVDRSCCAAPSSLSERAPATVSSDRGFDQRVLAVAVVVSTTHVLVAVAPPRAFPPALPGPSPPLLRTTILLI